MWILDTETQNAAKFGYKGCNQLTDAYLVETLSRGNAYDKAWITETTVRDIVNTPVTEDITSVVYKVNALVKKVPGDNFVNYYFYDLDEKTGAYTYTQCNGSDFAWLDAFDGKICTVYLTALNAKSVANDCFWRFLPVEVIDESYVFDVDGAPEFAVKYHGVTAIAPSYAVGAELPVITDVDSALLGFENVVIEYTSSNTSVLDFVTADGATKLVTLAGGKVTVTVKATLGTKEYTETVTVTVIAADNIPSISVSEAIAAELDTIVTVKGKVGPSTVNQDGGFYLIDDAGVIAVKLAVMDDIKSLTIGDEVIIKGKRSQSSKGCQTVIYDAEIVANFYGGGTYSTSSFIKDKTVADIQAAGSSPINTTKVYVVTGSLTKESTRFYTNYYIDGLRLYAKSGAQYAWLDAFFPVDATSATITVEIAACEWNASGLAGCVLSVITDDGKILNTLNFGK